MPQIDKTWKDSREVLMNLGLKNFALELNQTIPSNNNDDDEIRYKDKIDIW